MKNTTQKGKEAETFACEFLVQNGFGIIQRNYFTPFGEIDIIAKKDKILHFIEVKSGIGFEPVFNITKTKLERIIKSVEMYLKLKGSKDSYCLSAFILSKQNAQDSAFDVQWLENLTLFS